MTLRHDLKWMCSSISISSASFSTSSSTAEDTHNSKPWYHDNPSGVVSGVMTNDLENDSVLDEYFAANHAEKPPTPEELRESAMKNQNDGDDDDPLKALNIRRLKCFPRDRITEDGSRACNKMREKKLIPGLIYGGDKNLGISSHFSDDDNHRIWVKTPHPEIHREMDRYHRDISCRVYELSLMDEVSGDVLSTHRVIPRDVQMHPVLNKPYCVNYVRYYPGRTIKIPIRYINEEESPGLKRGGFILPITRHLEVIVENGVPIPESINLDCTDVRIKDVLRMERLIIPEGVTISKNVNQKDFLVGPVMGKGVQNDAESEEE